MKAKELKYYKPLDITQLSGSPWNTAEKVLGLDQDDKVIMAEPEETVTPEYVDEAIDQAMEAETARTEDTYAKKSEVPDLDDYYTKEEVDEAISGITVDLSDYYTKDETDQAISAATQDLASTDYVDDAIASETARTESTYLKQSDIEDDQFPTKNWVKGHTALAIEHSMEAETARTESTYAKKSEIPSLDGYAKTTAVTEDIQTAMAAETARTESTYLKEHQDISGKLDKTDFNTYTGATETVLAGKLDATAYTIDNTIDSASTNPVENRVIATALNNKPEKANVDANTNSRYFPQWNSDGIIIGKFGNIIYNVGHNINGLTYYILRDKNSGALPTIYAPTSAGTQGQLLVSTGGEPVWSDNNFVTSGDVANQIDASMAAETARTESTYLKEHQSLDNYYTKSEVDADFVSAATAVGQAIDAAVQGLASENYVDNAVSGLASEDYVNNAVTSATEGLASESYVDAAITSATQNLASEQYVDDAIAAIPEPDLSDYYTKSEVDAEITGATEDMATKTWVGQQGYLTQHQDLSAYAKTTAVTEDIATAMASETARTESTYAKQSQIPSLAGYATETYVDNAIASETARTESTYLKEHQDISGKLDKTDFNNYTGATETVLAEKLDASAYTVDNAMSSASTNPVENRVLNAALNGVTATTELTITNTDSAWQFYCDSNSQYYHFKDTSISKYKAVYLGDLAVTGLSIFTLYMADGNNNWMYMNPGDRPTTSNVGTLKYYVSNSGYGITFSKSRLDGTFDYYILFDTEEMYFVVYKTLPASITTISDHKANVSDLPVAQDKSDTKFFVYDDPGRSKGVVREVYLNYGYEINADSRIPEIRTRSTSWSGSNSEYNMRPIPGNEVVGGIKSAKDSVIINNAASALDGFTEQITLTLGNQSATDYAYLNWDNRYLYETDDPRYEVIPVSASTDANYTYFSNVSLSGITYYIENPINNFYDYSLNGKYELNALNNGYGILYIRSNVSSQKYLIIDKELLTVELSATLTITRTKNLNGAFVEPKDLTGGTETIIHTESVAIVGDSENVKAEFSKDGSSSTYLHSLKTTTNSSIFAYYLDSSEIFGKPFDFYINFIRISGTTYYFTTSPTAGDGVTASLSTTDSGNRAFTSENYNGYMILDTSNMEVSFASSLPVITTEETVTTIGILEDYWTTGETQSAITAATQGMVTSGDVATQIGTAMAAETARTESTYLKEHQSLDNYYTKSEVDAEITGATQYVPTTAGTAGQPLLSSGSGAPSWGNYKFAFLTQSQYNSLATKDNTTIYFIVG